MGKACEWNGLINSFQWFSLYSSECAVILPHWGWVIISHYPVHTHNSHSLTLFWYYSRYMTVAVESNLSCVKIQYNLFAVCWLLECNPFTLSFSSCISFFLLYSFQSNSQEQSIHHVTNSTHQQQQHIAHSILHHNTIIGHQHLSAAEQLLGGRGGGAAGGGGGQQHTSNNNLTLPPLGAATGMASPRLADIFLPHRSAATTADCQLTGSLLVPLGKEFLSLQ